MLYSPGMEGWKYTIDTDAGKKVEEAKTQEEPAHGKAISQISPLKHGS